MMSKNHINYVVPYPDPDRPYHVLLIPVSYEIWKDITRENDRIRKKMQYHGRCCCPKSQICFCTGECFNCMHQITGDTLSLDYSYASESDDESISLYETLEDIDASSFPEHIAHQEIVKEIIAYLQMTMPEALQVLELQFFNGLSERQALEKLGIARSTYRSRFDVIRNDLISKFDLT